MAIHAVKNNKFVISSHQVWMPGAYDNKKTARYAFQFPDEVLRKLQDNANINNGGYDGVITLNDLQQAKKKFSESC
jgi:hypothetical protein